MKKTILALVIALAASSAHAQGLSTNTVLPRLKLTAPSATPALTLATGARICLDPTCAVYLYGSTTSLIRTNMSLTVDNTMLAGSLLGITTSNAVSGVACNASREGNLIRVGGGTTGARTKLCFCTSDGAGTPAYAWVNVTQYSASEVARVGDATTCP